MMRWKSTPRLYQLRHHPTQEKLQTSEARFKIIPAGRRSGKTEIAKRRLIKALFDCHPWSVNYKPLEYNGNKWDDPNFFAAAPTRDQAKRIWWKDLKRMIHKDYVAAISESELTITTKWGASLSVVGLDKPERIEGTPWDGGVIDELANVKPGAFDAHIRPSLADRNGWCWMIGVPDMDSPGQVEYKARVDKAKTGIDPEWACFSWPSKDILPPEEVDSAARSMDPDLFRQEFGGEFVLASGLCFPTFDLKLHVDHAGKEAVYDHLLPIALSFDFNVNPFCFGVLQHRRGDKPIRPRVVREFRLTDSDTNVACNAFLDWYSALPYKPPSLTIYGDASGGARDSTSGITDWIIIQRMLKNLQPRFVVPSANPPIKDTVNAVRARLKNAVGEIGLSICPQATQLISDFQSALWPSDLEECHSLAWLRYFLCQEYAVGMEVPQTTESRLVVAGGAVNQGSAGGQQGRPPIYHPRVQVHGRR
jgi:hypothetical protein